MDDNEVRGRFLAHVFHTELEKIAMSAGELKSVPLEGLQAAYQRAHGVPYATREAIGMKHWIPFTQAQRTDAAEWAHSKSLKKAISDEAGSREKDALIRLRTASTEAERDAARAEIDRHSRVRMEASGVTPTAAEVERAKKTGTMVEDARNSSASMKMALGVGGAAAAGVGGYALYNKATQPSTPDYPQY